MSDLLIVRKAAGLSQSKMALYLGVSKSMIYHVERGLRDLRPAASLKATILFIEILKRNKMRLLPDTSQNERQQLDLQLQRAITEKNKIETHIAVLNGKLKRIKRSDKKRSALITTNSIVAENIRNGICDKNDKTFLALNELAALEALRYFGPKRQEKMEAKIRKLQAELLLLDAFIKENRLPLALPVMILKEAV